MGGGLRPFRNNSLPKARHDMRERRGSVMVSTFACHAADPGSIPGPGM